jgi:NADH-quinone oxidoreductase subunit N
LLILGVFINKSYKIINNLAILSLAFTFLIVINNSTEVILIFNNSYIIDSISTFMKLLTLVSSIFILIICNHYIVNLNINKFEYPILILSSILGMFLMISSYDLIVFYMGLELQSLSLYVLASFNRENKKSTEAGLKFFVFSIK